MKRSCSVNVWTVISFNTYLITSQVGAYFFNWLYIEFLMCNYSSIAHFQIFSLDARQCFHIKIAIEKFVEKIIHEKEQLFLTSWKTSLRLHSPCQNGTDFFITEFQEMHAKLEKGFEEISGMLTIIERLIFNHSNATDFKLKTPTLNFKFQKQIWCLFRQDQRK